MATPNIDELYPLNQDDTQEVIMRLGRKPNRIERAIFSAMWSEHCSYRSSKRFLKRLPSQGDAVVCSMGENAGVVQISDGWLAAFKMESHNHPSMIEPFHGAATGVGGILRDIFSLGARPIAAANSLRFGAVHHKRMAELTQGVVAGIAAYGNSFGVPTLLGESVWHKDYNQNILVNALALGILEEKHLIPSTAPSADRACWYVGSPTGRDGIHGAAMASESFSASSSESQRPTVQVGDPFAGKQLMEVCLMANAQGLISAMQDMGAAGILSSSVEMADKAGLGLDIDLACVPLRDTQMQAEDILLSESQERMLLFPKPGKEEALEQLFHRHHLCAVKIGRTTTTGKYRVFWKETLLSTLPVAMICSPPEEETQPIPPAVLSHGAPSQAIASLKELCQNINLADKSAVWEQFDWLIQERTLRGPPSGGATLIAVPEAGVVLALSAQGSHAHCMANARFGASWCAARAWLDVAITGTKPLAFTDNLNFGNPEDPVVLYQFSEAIEGLREAGEELSCPYISGNVSLYNETEGHSIPPTPVIAALGSLPKDAPITQSKILKEEHIFLIGTPSDVILGSHLPHTCANMPETPLTLDWQEIRQSVDLVHTLWHEKAITHAVTAGSGLIITLLRLCFRHHLGLELYTHLAQKQQPEGENIFWQADNRLPILVMAPEPILKNSNGVPIRLLGKFNANPNKLSFRNRAHDGCLPPLAPLVIADQFEDQSLPLTSLREMYFSILRAQMPPWQTQPFERQA